MADVTLISMPWQSLHSPSLALGILKPLVERLGVSVEVKMLNLKFVDYLAVLGSRYRLSFDEYSNISNEYYEVGLGDWIFAVPPFRNNSKGKDEAYREYLCRNGIPKPIINKAFIMRETVPVFLETCATEVMKCDPKIVGFTSMFSQNVSSLTLALLIKMRAPQIKIIFGGANCQGDMGSGLLASFPWIDAVVQGEGEIAFPSLVESWLNGRPIRPQEGVCHRESGYPPTEDLNQNGFVPMDLVPTPDYTEYFDQLQCSRLRGEIEPRLRLPFESARGCWWGAKSHCTFCGLNGAAMNFRSKNQKVVLDEIMTLARRYRWFRFFAVDNILDMKYFQEFLPNLRDLGYDMTLYYEVKSNLKKWQVHLLREAGITQINPGIESLSNPILKLMRKGVTALQNVRLLKWCAQYRIDVFWNLLYGFPGEPETEYDRMAKIIPSLIHLQAPHLNRLHIDRFSPYHNHPQSFGLRITGPREYYKHIYTLEDELLSKIAYTFEMEYQDQKDPESYIENCRREVHRWQSAWERNAYSLVYRNGPGYLNIQDWRYSSPGKVYTLNELEQEVYLACDSGSQLDKIFQHLRAELPHKQVDESEVYMILQNFIEQRLMFEDDGHYLSLALPANPKADLERTSGRTHNK